MSNTSSSSPKRIAVLSLVGSSISVWYSSEWSEYQVKVSGKPNATYHTDDRSDALQTAQRMRNGQAVVA